MPHLKACNEVFVRGNVVRYVHLMKSDVDTDVLTDACRKESGKGRAH